MQTTAGTKQTARGAFFDIRAAYDGQLQSAGTELSGTPDFQSSDVCLSAAAPGDISFKPGFHPGSSERKVGCTQAKQNIFAGTRAALTGVVGRNSPFFVHNEAGYGDIWR